MTASTHRVPYLPLYFFCLTGGVLLPASASGIWEGTKDNTPATALEHMFAFELAGEGHKACLTATMAHFRAPARVPRLSAEAHAYLEELGRVAQHRDLQGHAVPAWVGQMHHAIEQQEPLLCHASWERIMKEHLNALNARHPRHLPEHEPHDL